jgi:NADH dehydrogenase FAD-containing subunit
MTKAHVVIIGGGFAGTYCARLLEHDLKVTLIDTKENFEFTPSFLRLLVQPNKLKTIQVSLLLLLLPLPSFFIHSFFTKDFYCLVNVC